MSQTIRLFICLLCLAPSVTAKESSQSSMKLLIIGDSISRQYTATVKEALQDHFDVSHNEGNAKSTHYSLKHIDEWLAVDKWQHIHVNWGLHDLKKGAGAKPGAAEAYKKRLTMLLDRCQDTGATLSIATTTPVPQKNKHGRVPEHIVAFNTVLITLANQRGIPVIDLYQTILPVRAQAQIEPEDVHFRDAANTLLGLDVAMNIAQQYDFRDTVATLSNERQQAFEKVANLTIVEGVAQDKQNLTE